MPQALKANNVEQQSKNCFDYEQLFKTISYVYDFVQGARRILYFD